MAATDNLGKQFMYHASAEMNRYGINKTGLDVEQEQGYGSTARAVYLSPHPSKSPYDDVWKVDVSDYELQPDDPAQMHEFSDVGGSWFVGHSIPRERLELHRTATKERTYG